MNSVEHLESKQITKSQDFATMQDYLLARHNKLANLMDMVPGLARCVRDLCEAILRLCEAKNINPLTLKPRTRISPDGKIFIDLNLPSRAKE